MSIKCLNLVIISSICLLSLSCMNKSGQNTTHGGTVFPLGSATSKPVSNGDVVVDGCQESVTLSKGQKLIVKLPATEGTGYIWQIKTPLTVLKSIDSDVIQYEKQPADGAVGKTSKQLIHFTAETVGTETLNLVYLRPFDKENVADKCSIRIIVQ